MQSRSKEPNVFCTNCGHLLSEEHCCPPEESPLEQDHFDTEKDLAAVPRELLEENMFSASDLAVVSWPIQKPKEDIFFADHNKQGKSPTPKPTLKSESYDPGPGGVLNNKFFSASDLVGVRLPTFLQPPSKDAPPITAQVLPNAPNQQTDPNLGSVIGGYEIIEKLSDGGYGSVYKAFSEETNTFAAIKLVYPRQKKSIEELWRLFEEARITSKIQHPNIVKVYNVGVLPDGISGFLIMEFLEGCDFYSFLSQKGTISHEDIYDIFIPICEALSATHECSITHRDLKPENIFICNDGNSKIIKLLDFGVAKISNRIGNFQTMHGTVIGTPAYMSPEQATGHTIDVRSDIYSVGVMLYRAILGRLPFSGKTPEEFLYKHVHEAPVSMRTYMENIPVWLDAIVMKCLNKNPKHRPQSIQEVGFILKSCLR
jgi:hypothetical protein